MSLDVGFLVAKKLKKKRVSARLLPNIISTQQAARAQHPSNFTWAGLGESFARSTIAVIRPTARTDLILRGLCSNALGRLVAWHAKEDFPATQSDPPIIIFPYLYYRVAVRCRCLAIFDRCQGVVVVSGGS